MYIYIYICHNVYVCMYVCIYIYIYIHIHSYVYIYIYTHMCTHITTGVCEKSIPFAQALALQSSSRNCSPAPDF